MPKTVFGRFPSNFWMEASSIRSRCTIVSIWHAAHRNLSVRCRSVSQALIKRRFGSLDRDPSVNLHSPGFSGEFCLQFFEGVRVQVTKPLDPLQPIADIDLYRLQHKLVVHRQFRIGLVVLGVLRNEGAMVSHMSGCPELPRRRPIPRLIRVRLHSLYSVKLAHKGPTLWSWGSSVSPFDSKRGSC